MTRWKLPKPWIVFVAAVIVGLAALGVSIGVPWYRTNQLIAEIAGEINISGSRESAAPKFLRQACKNYWPGAEWYLPSRFDYLSIDGPCKNQQFLRRLSNQTSLFALFINRASFADSEWSFIPGTSLRILSVEDGFFSDASLQNLPACPRLKALHLNKCAITGPGLSSLSGFPEIDEIELDENPLTDTGLRWFAACPKLATLTLQDTEIRGRGFVALRACSALALLDLSRTPIDAEGLAEIAQLVSLRKLVLSETQATPAGYRALCRLPNLQDLTLESTPIDDSVLVALAGCRQLKSLAINFTQVSDAAVRQLFRECPSLEEVHLRGTSSSDEDDEEWLPRTYGKVKRSDCIPQ